MTHQDNLAAVRAACVAANPDIVEKKFCSKVFDKDGNYVGIYVVDSYNLIVDGYSDGELRNIDEGCGCCSSTSKYENCKFETEITLPDVLLALGERANRFLDYRHFVASLKRENGTVTILDNSDSGGRLSDGTEICEWNLRLPLSGQPEETVSYLAALLKNND